MHQPRTRSGGKHRKQINPVRGRVAFVAAATGIASSAGATGAALAAAPQSGSPAIKLAANDVPAADLAAPQILEFAEFKPAFNLTDQLIKAIAFSAQVEEADHLARTPKNIVVKPAEGLFTSGFGARWGTMHNGIDIANAMGTPIVAAMSGTVIDAGPASGFGNWVRVLHDDGTITVYGHMETVEVVVGQHVDAGQRIAGMGSRGWSTGSHLHFEVHPAGQGPIDPVPWLAERGVFVA
ncbi:M23 family metallopeptidase [Corynebacterium sp. ES2794-CONJ1]|uniref:M23 family metallopeptidase n=1 Tax=unclassified Corynebacterium TaxID=2624378 RepID=UPI00216A2A54|nr:MULTISPECIES: M23 family metallopeptidase [unclassified Corynebacterium]MCS4490031.1 M23 family metallopeptidase [Corynebacterium sp. ES2775-CONJ]MCS4491607.1 M23 family metallopeptidase [Corynebacterium sp. ES2715-CONJ3]MCS4531711.1 M23 family metallopeptidase [Corynebacterium sp. ES2730-CONJ]MCU9519107.1 M23 family metallopeptidase [Corynebacterium sp. ES2794-CONJ1]